MNNVITDIANGDDFSQRNGWFGRIVRQTIKLSDFTSHPVVVNKDALKAAIDAAKEALKEEDKYTEESVKALKDAVAEAEKVAADENATQESVDAATKAVEEATKGLAEKPAVPEADKTALKAVLADAAQKLAGADAYTEESVKALKDAVDLAQNVFDNSDASQTEVDAAVTAV